MSRRRLLGRVESVERTLKRFEVGIRGERALGLLAAFGGGGEAGLVGAQRNGNQRVGGRKGCCSYDYRNVVFSGSALVQFEVYGTYTVEYRSECGFCAITVRGFWELQC